MKDTRPIDIQVAELTPEHKRKIPKIYKAHLLFSFVLIGSLLVALLFAQIGVFAARSDLDAVQHKIHAGGSLGGIHYFAEETAAYEAYDSAIHTRMLVSIIGGISVLILALGAQVFIAKKFPFYSEKKYTYLKNSPRRG